LPTKNQNSSFSEKLFVLCITLPLIFKVLLLVDTVAIGCDTRTHVYKAYVLTKQIKTLPISLWGSWDWSWHLGNEFLDIYSPLPYYGIAVPSLAGIPLDISLKFLLLIFILIAAFGIYFLAKELTKNIMLSLLSIILFLYSPIFITTLIDWGNVGKIGAYAFAPPALFFTEKIIRSYKKEQKEKYAFFVSIMLSLTILNNIAVGLWVMIMCGFWLAFLSKNSVVKAIAKLIRIGSASILLSAFFLAPLIKARTTILPVTNPPNGATLPFIAEALLRGGVLNWILIAILAVTVLLHPKKKLDNKVKFFFFFIALWTIYEIVAYLTVDFAPFLSTIRGDRSLVVNLVFSSIIPVYLFKLSNKDKKTLKFVIYIIIFFIFVSGMLIPPYYPLQEKKYFSAAEYIAEDFGWFRYAFLPREPIGSVFPQYSGKPYVDGWSFLSDPEIFSILGTAVFGLEKIEKLIAENGTLGVSVLKYLGVKYIIVEKYNPIYGYNLSETIYRSIESSGLTIRAYRDGSVGVFQVLGFELVHIYNEVPENLEDAIRESLSFTENLAVRQILQNEEELHLDLIAFKAFYVVIPVVNSNKLEAYVNGEKVETVHAYGNLMAIYLPYAGEYQISIRLKEFQLFRVLGASLSFFTLFFGSVFVTFVTLKSKRGRK